jgi:hypothetical protein
MTVYCKRFHCVTPNTARRNFDNVDSLQPAGRRRHSELQRVLSAVRVHTRLSEPQCRAPAAAAAAARARRIGSAAAIRYDPAVNAAIPARQAGRRSRRARARRRYQIPRGIGRSIRRALSRRHRD